MTRKHVVVVGGNFAGMTAALSLRHELHGDVDVTVISASDQFLFTPSLIWLPFGKREPKDIMFPMTPTFEEHGVNFVHATVTKIDPVEKKISTSFRSYHYDYLVIASGYQNNFDVCEGLGPGGNAYTITTLDEAIHAGEGWRNLIRHPGDVVVGATQGAGCFGAAYEYLFNMSYQLKRAGIKKQVKLTYVTAEPFVGHFGIGGLPHGEALLGMFLKKEKINVITNASMNHVDSGRIVLDDDRKIEFSYAMIIPPFVGQDVIRQCPSISDSNGFVNVRDTYQSLLYDDVYAVGVAAAADVPWQTPTAVGIPKTGFPTERQAHIAARNIAAQIQGNTLPDHKTFGEIPAVCVMDAGNNGVIILADHMLPPRSHGVLIPGPQSHALKVGFEKYFMWKMRHGYVTLP